MPIFDQWRDSGRDYVLCGDWNIVHTSRHQELASNQKNSGCLPEERAWLDDLCSSAVGSQFRGRCIPRHAGQNTAGGPTGARLAPTTSDGALTTSS